jgi:hypothetical protein
MTITGREGLCFFQLRIPLLVYHVVYQSHTTYQITSLVVDRNIPEPIKLGVIVPEKLITGLDKFDFE